MKYKLLATLILFSLFNSFVFSQEETDWVDDEKKSRFFGGVNVGAFFANKNTAIMYTGGSNITRFGIPYILNIPTLKPIFDNYFQYPYSLNELPQNPSYRAALDIGLHAGINLNKEVAIYIDINTAQLKFEQFFTVEIDNPINRSVEPTYEQIPIFGEEKRFNFNLGTQLNLYHNDYSTVYFALFGNFNSTRMERNYFIINNAEYQINHITNQQNNNNPGGVGYGLGSGLGYKYKLTDNLTIDFNYNLYYTKTSMVENLNPFGIHNGIMLRVIWN